MKRLEQRVHVIISKPDMCPRTWNILESIEFVFQIMTLRDTALLEKSLLPKIKPSKSFILT